MSRIGKQPILIPAKVKVNVSGRKVSVEGPKGKLEFAWHPAMKVESDGKAVKVTRPDGEVEEMATDECIRPNTSLEQLAALPQIQEGCPDMTAGNSSPISDGAAALMIASEDAVKRFGLKPRARFHAFAVAGCEPIVMLQGPIPATKKLLDRSGMSLDDSVLEPGTRVMIIQVDGTTLVVEKES